jgi:hypothetical protein
MSRWLEIFRATLKNEDRGRLPDRAIPSHTEVSSVASVASADAWPSPSYDVALATLATLKSPVWLDMAPSGGRKIILKSASSGEHGLATLARWILKDRPHEVHVRRMLREVRLPGLRTADQVKAAAAVLVDAHWLREPTKTVFGQPRSRVAYAVNPRLWEERA